MSEPPESADAVRRAVNRTYAAAVTASGDTPTIATKLAGYTDAQLATVPDGVTASFFGCGNPLSLAGVRPGDTVVDLGSGAGLDLILAGQAVGPTGRVIGVDMTDAMIERARANVARAGLTNVEIRSGLIERLPVDAGAADLVISNCVISLSPEKDAVFSEISRVLKPGGAMAISDIVVDKPLAFLLRRLTRVVPSIAFARTEDEYVAAMTRAGLASPQIASRLVYEPDDLLGMFGEELLRTSSSASACPIGSFASRARTSKVARTALRLGARAAAGHVWSARFTARKPGA
jgi:SAM-dependent methyltransferase